MARGAPKRPISEAREFGRLVEAERNPKRREKLETLFFRVRRSDPKRWGSVSKMWRLWRDFQVDQNQQRATERQIALMDRQARQLEENFKRVAAEFGERIRQVDAEFEQRNPRLAKLREHFDRKQKEFETHMNDVLLKLPPESRHLLRK